MAPVHRIFISLPIIFERNGLHSLKDDNHTFEKKETHSKILILRQIMKKYAQTNFFFAVLCGPLRSFVVFSMTGSSRINNFVKILLPRSTMPNSRYPNFSPLIFHQKESWWRNNLSLGSLGTFTYSPVYQISTSNGRYRKKRENGPCLPNFHFSADHH